MQRAKNLSYATAGVQMSAGIEMNVRSHVFIPDAEAGSENSRNYYQAGPVVERKPEITLSRNHAAMLLLVVALIVGVVLGVKALHYAKVTAEYQETLVKIENVVAETAKSAEQLAKARDTHRIRYRATTEFGMIPMDAVESIPVIAPQTRTNNSSTNGLTANNPFADGYGILSGSR